MPIPRKSLVIVPVFDIDPIVEPDATAIAVPEDILLIVPELVSVLIVALL